MTASENGGLDPQTVAELRRLARSCPQSGRQAAAKASALRTLERLRRGKRGRNFGQLGRHPGG